MTTATKTSVAGITVKPRKLSNAQRYMLETLAESGPFDICAMSINFGRRWSDVFHRLESMGLTYFAPYAKDDKHYRVFGTGFSALNVVTVEGL